MKKITGPIVGIHPQAALFFAALVMALTAFFFPAAADPVAGWNEENGKVYYYAVVEIPVQTGEGGQEGEGSQEGEGGQEGEGSQEGEGAVITKLEKATGVQLISGSYFTFAESGELQTGWVQTEDGIRFHQPEGTLGIRGRALTGMQSLNDKYFYFDEKGVMAEGWTEIGKYTYFFSTKGSLGTVGSAYVKKWVKYNGSRYYFGKKGRLLKSRWIDSRYVDETGKRLVNTITPDGYQVGATGKKVSAKKVSGWVKVKGKWYYFNSKKKTLYRSTFKKINGARYYFDETGARVKKWQTIGKYKYYFNSKGVMQTGEVKIGSKYYYFNSKGRLQISTTVDGYTTDAKGVITKRPQIKKKVLITAGHGQGDPGACSALGQEYLKTREFAAMIYNNLKVVSGMEVDFYQNGSTSYDMYQRNKAALGSLSAYAGGVKGNGGLKSTVKTLLGRSSACPKIWEYDYVLEVHFNATGESAKDVGGNGSIKGFGIYINQYKSAAMRKIDNEIVGKIRSTGMPIWGRGSGQYTSAGLLNARVCQELGVNYSLIETAFIDDRDDMNFYNANKTKMAKAVASAIVSFLK